MEQRKVKVAVWEDALASDGRELYLAFQVHNEAITIPESVDATRALTGIETDGSKSIEKTNRALGIVKSFLPKTIPEEAEHVAMSETLRRMRTEFMQEGFKGAEEPAEPVPTPVQHG